MSHENGNGNGNGREDSRRGIFDEMTVQHLVLWLTVLGAISGGVYAYAQQVGDVGRNTELSHKNERTLSGIGSTMNDVRRKVDVLDERLMNTAKMVEDMQREQRLMSRKLDRINEPR